MTCGALQIHSQPVRGCFWQCWAAPTSQRGSQQRQGLKSPGPKLSAETPPSPDAWPKAKSYSWRVALLPYLEQDELYKKLTETSSSFVFPATLPEKELDKLPELKKAMNAPVVIYTLPRWRDRPGKTVFRRVETPDRPERLIVAESAKLVDWAKPGDELILEMEKPLPRMGGNFTGGFFALRGDGKVHFVEEAVP